VQLLNFALVPRHWRAPFVSGTGLLWTAYLSNARGSAKEVPEAKASEDKLTPVK